MSKTAPTAATTTTASKTAPTAATTTTASKTAPTAATTVRSPVASVRAVEEIVSRQGFDDAVRTGGMSRPDRVLVALLGTPDESAALADALEAFPDAEVTAIAVVTPLDGPMSEGSLLERGDDRIANARERAASVVESVAGETERVDHVALEGLPGEVIPEYATEYDHVVVGPRGSSIARRMTGRGVAEKIVDRCEVPVTVFDPEGQERP